MEMTQLNIRIPAALKAQGDSVLAEAGVSASELVRSLWEYLAIFHTVPEFGKTAKSAGGACAVGVLQGDAIAHATQDKDDDLVGLGSTMVQAFFTRSGLHWDQQANASYEDLREDMYAQELAEYEALDA